MTWRLPTGSRTPIGSRKWSARGACAPRSTWCLSTTRRRAPSLRELRDDGFEIGVHGYTHDGMLFSSWRTFVQRVVTINEFGRQLGASGFRSPATYRNQQWFHMLGFEYDSSVADTAPFEPQPGGCASLFPFQVDGGLIELPGHPRAGPHPLRSARGDHRADMADEAAPDQEGQWDGLRAHAPRPRGGLRRAAGERKALRRAARHDRCVRSMDPASARTRAVVADAHAHSGDEWESLEGGSVGMAILESSGQVEVVPPARVETAPVGPHGGRRHDPRSRFACGSTWPTRRTSSSSGRSSGRSRPGDTRSSSRPVTTPRQWSSWIAPALTYTAIGHHGGKSSIGKLWRSRACPGACLACARQQECGHRRSPQLVCAVDSRRGRCGFPR